MDENFKIRTQFSTTCYLRVLIYFRHVPNSGISPKAIRQPRKTMYIYITVVLSKIWEKKPRGCSLTRWSEQIKTITGLCLQTWDVCLEEERTKTEHCGSCSSAAKSFPGREQKSAFKNMTEKGRIWTNVWLSVVSLY